MRRAYTETGWRIRDILGHIATWDLEVANWLRAFSAGGEYSIPGVDRDETEFNEQAVFEQRKLSTEGIRAEWEQARKGFLGALSEIPLDQFPAGLLCTRGDSNKEASANTGKGFRKSAPLMGPGPNHHQ